MKRSFICALISLPLAAQWLNRPAPGIPRTKDGKPNLSAPAPKTADGKPDLSGIWRTDKEYFPLYVLDILWNTKPEVRPWAEALAKQRFEGLGKDYPATYCLPGPLMGVGGLTKILQAPNLVLMLYEFNDNNWRQIFMDGRKLPVDPQPIWMGYSVGRWEGETLVVETAGFNDKTWLDGVGHPHTEELRMTERYRRPDFGHLDIQITFDDPKVFPKPVTVPMRQTLEPDTEILEAVCTENERDWKHMVGK